MSTFTMRLNDVMSYSYNIGLQAADYPIFDEAYRPTLNKRITDHYRFWEIGAETPEMFIFFLNRKLREIMPLYNQLYQTTLLQYNILDGMDYTETIHAITGTTIEQAEHSTSNQTTTANSKSRNVSNEFPQTQLGGNTDYATSAADAVSETAGTGTSAADGTSNTTSGGTNDTARHMVGRTGSAPALIMEAREAIINVDMLVVKELEPCFMQVWENGDSFTDGWGSLYGTIGFMGGFGPW